MGKGKRIAAGTVRDVGTHQLESDDQIQMRRLNSVMKRSEVFVGIAERIAQNKFCYLNWLVPGGASLFPQNWKLRQVRYYFPFAEGGPLLMDQPKNPIEEQMCREKADILRTKGMRYAYIGEGMDETDVRMQLGAQ